jgi:hypothetical protein
MCGVGNRAFNAKYEARLNGAIKPSAASSLDARLQYITAKYVHLQFASTQIAGV